MFKSLACLVLLVASSSAQFLTLGNNVGNFGNQGPQTLRTVFLSPAPQRVAVSQPQILAVAAPQPVRTVITRPITVAQPQPQPLTVEQPVSSFSSSSGSSGSSSSSFRDDSSDESGPPTPYSFAYDADLEDGTTSHREESGDANGAVKGSYSYKDADGLFRTVDYVADENGFRATIRTNEPGMARTDPEPADVQIDVEPVPENVLQKYANIRGSSFSSSSNTGFSAPQQLPPQPQPQSQPLAPQTAPVAVNFQPQPQPIQTLRLVSQPRPQPIAVVLRPQAQPQFQTLRLQTVNQPQAQSGVRLIPVTSFLGGSTGFGQQGAASNVILLSNFQRK